MNKDEAEKCLELGRKFLRAGDHAKAVKFLDKSLRLYPLPGVKELKERAEAEQARAASGGGGSTAGGGGGGSSSSSGNGEARRRHPAGVSAGGGGGGSGGSGQPSSSGA